MADNELFVSLIERPPIPSFCLGAHVPYDGFKRLSIPVITFGAQPKTFVINSTWEEIAPPKEPLPALRGPPRAAYVGRLICARPGACAPRWRPPLPPLPPLRARARAPTAAPAHADCAVLKGVVLRPGGGGGGGGGRCVVVEIEKNVANNRKFCANN